MTDYYYSDLLLETFKSLLSDLNSLFIGNILMLFLPTSLPWFNSSKFHDFGIGGENKKRERRRGFVCTQTKRTVSLMYHLVVNILLLLLLLLLSLLLLSSSSSSSLLLWGQGHTTEHFPKWSFYRVSLKKANPSFRVHYSIIKNYFFKNVHIIGKLIVSSFI